MIGICPSKNPMRVVHDRISDLFHKIRLDELCCLPAHGNVLSAIPASQANR